MQIWFDRLQYVMWTGLWVKSDSDQICEWQMTYSGSGVQNKREDGQTIKTYQDLAVCDTKQQIDNNLKVNACTFSTNHERKHQ